MVAKNPSVDVAVLSVFFLSKMYHLNSLKSLFQVFSIFLSLHLEKGLSMIFSFLFSFSFNEISQTNNRNITNPKDFKLCVKLCTMQKKGKTLHSHFRHTLPFIPFHSVIGNPRFYVWSLIYFQGKFCMEH